MKKIIALAVASAFVAPVMAAEVSVGGHVEYTYRMTDGSQDSFQTSETELNVSASETLDNGLSIVATINLIDDTDNTLETATSGTYTTGSIDTQGTNLKLSGEFGSLSIGDVSGALDNVGDYTDVAPSGGSFNGDGNDHALLFVAPTVIEGVKISLSHSPDGSNDAGTGTGIKSGAEGASVAYSFGMGEVYYGYEKFAPATGESDKITGYGVKASIAGVNVAYEIADYDDNGNDENIRGMSVTYKMGDILVGYEKQLWEDDSTPGTDDLQNESVIFAEYNLGANLDVYVSVIDVQDTKVSSTTTSGATADQTRIGVEYSF